MSEETKQITGQEAEHADAATVEELFARIESALERMQQEDVTLEESFALYEQGVSDIRRCTEMLDLVEKKMLVLSAEGVKEE